MCAGLASGKRPDLPDVVRGQPRDGHGVERGWQPARRRFAVGGRDTIARHDSLSSLSTVLLRIAVPAVQAACRGFEPRLPLHIPVSCVGRHAA
jgi:hypothetical protein